MKENSKQNIRVGVVGCGAIAEMFHIPALDAYPKTRNHIALSDLNVARLNNLARTYNVDFFSNDYTELDGEVDGIIISTPPDTHFEIASYFLKKRIPVLCEKPISNDFKEAQELARLSVANETPLLVNQTRRFFPTYEKIKHLIQSGELGEVKKIIYHEGADFNWPAASQFHFDKSAKGVWSDVGIHLLDTVCYWLGGEPELIESLNDNEGGPEALATVRFRHRQCEIEIKVSRLGRLENGFKIIGTDGTIEQESEEFSEVIVRKTDGRQRKYACGKRSLKYNDFARPLIENFVKVIEQKESPIVSVESVLVPTKLMQEAYEHAKTYAKPWDNHLVSNLPEYVETRATSSDRQFPKKVLVTGASGFVGNRVVEALKKSGLGIPLAGVRSWSRAARPARVGAEIVVCDISDFDSVNQAMKNVDAVVHCAYVDNHESVVNGTRNLLEAAVQNGITNFVYLSSAEAFGLDHEGILDESVIPMVDANSYGDWKLSAESVCMEYHARGLQPTILRPSLIYGPFGISWSVFVAKRLQSGNWGIFEQCGDGIANLIYIDDLVQGILLALANPEARGEVFNINGPQQPTWNEYFVEFNQRLGLPPLKQIKQSKSRFKTKVMDGVGKVTSFFKSKFEDKLMEIYLQGGTASRWMKRLKSALDSTPSSNELNDLYSRQIRYSDEKIRKLLGYQPSFSLERGIDATIEWMRLHELLTNVDPATKPETTHAEVVSQDNNLVAETVEVK
ncbi:MAG: NAD-dependent epimerase/dehydratase family protein [Planctomycetota bacterium]